jgi:hypothetical protein
MASDKKIGTSYIITEIIRELIHTQREEVHRRIELTRDLASWVSSMVDDKKDATEIIKKTIDDIEEVRESYDPRIDYSQYDTAQRAKFEREIADILQRIYQVITKYDLIDPSGVLEGKAKGWGVIQEKT